MSWTTIYISGRPGFREEVLHELEQSGISFMPGSTEGSSDICLFWMDDETPLRDFKKAIGSKTVFKYRLQFHENQEDFHTPEKRDTLTTREKAMIREMHAWQASLKYRNSA